MRHAALTLSLLVALAHSVFAAPPTKPAAKPAPTWKVEQTKSAMDDSVTVVLSTPATSTIQAWPRKVVRPRLFLRCKEGEVDAYIFTGATPAVETTGATVQIRLDKEPAATIVMGKSTDGEALFFQDAKGVISRLVSYQAMLFRFTPFNSPPVETSFRLAGLARSVVPLQKACDWDAAAEQQAAKAEQAARAEAVKLREAAAALEPDEHIRWGFASALPVERELAINKVFKRRQPTESSIAILVAALSDPEEHIRRDAAMVLGELGAPAAAALPALEAVLAHPKTGPELFTTTQTAINKIKHP